MQFDVTWVTLWSSLGNFQYIFLLLWLISLCLTICFQVASFLYSFIWSFDHPFQKYQVTFIWQRSNMKEHEKLVGIHEMGSWEDSTALSQLLNSLFLVLTCPPCPSPTCTCAGLCWRMTPTAQDAAVETKRRGGKSLCLVLTLLPTDGDRCPDLTFSGYFLA